MPGLAAPESAQAAAALLADAAARGERVVPCGGRTKLAPGPELEAALLLSTTKLTQGLAHYAGDLVATAPAGMTLHAVNAALAAQRQWLPLDPPDAGATIGGLVASNDAGPRRHRYGAPRDLIIGIEVALVDGRVVRAGGRVVKNVAGYDLSRLFCGSYGSLGVVTSATFKLAPLPQISRTVVATPAHLQQAVQLALDVAASPLTPSCIELEAPEPRLLVRFESTMQAADRMAATAAALLQPGSRSVTTVSDAPEAEVWRLHDARLDGPALVRVSLLPAMLAPFLARLQAASADGWRWRAAASAALGLVDLVFDGEEAAVVAGVSATRTIATALGGHLRLRRAPASVRARVPAWGPPSGAARVAQAVKMRFDPAGILPWPWPRAEAHGH